MMRGYWRYLLLILLCLSLMLFFASFDGSFMGSTNVMNLLIQAAILGITAFGLTMVMKTGHYDFSLGGVVGLTAVISAQVHAAGGGTFTALLATLAVGMLFGVVNGVLISLFSFRDYLVTFATMFIANGVDILAAKGGHGIALAAEQVPGLVFFGYADVFGIPVIVLVLGLITLLAACLMDHTAFGNELRAIGMNPRAARFSGINVEYDVAWTFALAGMLYGLAGFLLSSRLISVPSLGGEPYFLGSFAAVYLGSVFLRGEPNIVGTLVAAFFTSVLRSGFAQVGLPFYFQTMMTALVIILSLVFSIKILRHVSQGQ